MEATVERVNFYILTEVKNNISASEIHGKLVTAHGEENVPSLRQIQRKAKEYREGDRVSCERKTGSGRPRTARSEDNVETVRIMIEEDNTVSLQHLSTELDLHESTVYRILTNDLGKKSFCARWVPYALTESQKLQRVNGAQQILREMNGNVLVIDEKFLYGKPHPPQQNVRSWGDSSADRPTLIRLGMSAKKFHIIVGINFRGDHHFEVLEAGENVNSERYILFLKKIMDVRREGTMTIMHDNARPHVSKLTTDFLSENNINRVFQPPYSPDMNLCDRYIFRNMEVDRKNMEFSDRASVSTYLANFLPQFSRHKLAREFTRLRQDLQKIIECKGDYLIPHFN